MTKKFLMILFLAVFLGACGSSAFKIIKDPQPDAEGFISKDVLQVLSVGYPSFGESDPQKKKREAFEAAEIMARLRSIDFLLSELQNESAEMYQTLMLKIGSRLSSERYDPVYGDELLDGGRRADDYFGLLSLAGYSHTNWYQSKDGGCWMIYRVVKADLTEYGRSGFGIYR